MYSTENFLIRAIDSVLYFRLNGESEYFILTEIIFIIYHVRSIFKHVELCIREENDVVPH